MAEPQQANEIIKIGAVMPLSGGEVLFGTQGLQGVQLAVVYFHVITNT